MSDRDYIDALLHSESEAPHQVIDVNVLGLLRRRSMVVHERAVSSEEIEGREAAMLAATELPIPFWDEDHALEPLNTFDYAVLQAAGVTPTEFEIAVLEEQLERNIR
jgi:hypothetical protein